MLAHLSRHSYLTCAAAQKQKPRTGLLLGSRLSGFRQFSVAPDPPYPISHSSCLLKPPVCMFQSFSSFATHNQPFLENEATIGEASLLGSQLSCLIEACGVPSSGRGWYGTVDARSRDVLPRTKAWTCRRFGVCASRSSSACRLLI
jgi:hypothetical protein